MSKERLEEIKTQLDRFMTSANKPVLFREDAEWVINYAKEQAERVQELENQITKMAVARYKDSEELDETNKQNKRYRGKISTALDMLQGTASDNVKVNNVGYLLTETLEGESE